MSARSKAMECAHGGENKDYKFASSVEDDGSADPASRKIAFPLSRVAPLQFILWIMSDQ